MSQGEGGSGGRPTSYKEEHNKTAYQLALLGLTDAEMAKVFGVDERTINNWKIVHPKFFQSIKEGKEIADAKVVSSLYQRAVGYEHPEEKVFCYEGEVVTHQQTKHYAPDTGACMAWLKNRQPSKWRDKQDVEVTHKTYEDMLHDVRKAKE